MQDLKTKVELKYITTVELKSGGGDFPGGAVVKSLPTNAGDTGSIPGPG